MTEATITNAQALVANARSYIAQDVYPMALRGLLTDLVDVIEHPEHPETKTLDDVWESVEKLTRSLHVVPDEDPAVTEALNQIDDDPINVPPTNFGVRITFADGSGYDIDNVDGVQVRDKAHNTFPFGFVEVPNPDGTPSGEWRAGYWAPEDGLYRPFDPVQQPNPNGGW